MLGLLREDPPNRAYPGLRKGLMVTTEGGCGTCFELDAIGGTGLQTLLGAGRASEIIVNILLPFTFAWSRSASRPELGSKAFELYRFHPGLAVNSVVKHMARQFGLSGSLVNSALRQQGSSTSTRTGAARAGVLNAP
ncbi:MAG: hypothetical protein QF369_02750 [Dehalococcoidales bacterium]|nr:hypothetical protein [Dehalococcoidales bacterium]